MNCRRRRIELFSPDKLLLYQLVPLRGFFFRFFGAVFFVDVGFLEFLRQCSDVFAGRPEPALLGILTVAFVSIA